MLVCGIDITGSEVIIVTVKREGDQLIDLTGGLKKLKLQDDENTGELRSFIDGIFQYLDDLEPQQIGIMKRPRKGRFSASAASFKLEALLQNYRGCEVVIEPPKTVASYLTKNPIALVPQNKYQEKAMHLACYLQRS